MTLEFQAPPLLEVVIRMVLLGPLDFSFAGLRRTADALNERFPSVTELDEISVGPGPLPFILRPGRTFGLRFGTRDGLTLDVQPNLLLVRWQKDVNSRHGYPRFPRLRDTLQWSAEQIATGHPSLQFSITNMAYRSFVSTPAPARFGDLRKYVKLSYLLEAVSSDAPFHELNASWSDEGTDLRMHLRGVAAIDALPVASGFELNLIAGQQFEPTPWPTAVIESNHTSLISLFRTLATPHALEEWRLVHDR